LGVKRAELIAFMRQEQTRAATRGWNSDVEVRDDAVGLVLTATGRPRRKVVIVSPGDRWISLEVDGGFSLDHFEEAMDEGDFRGVFEHHLQLAESYLRSGGRLVRGRLRGFETLIVPFDSKEEPLRRSLASSVRILIMGDKNSHLPPDGSRTGS